MLTQTLGHYRIEAKLGEGGMGVVYKARDLQLDRPVALKVLPVASAADPRRRERFIREAKAASALNHPNIVTIHEIGSSQGMDFIVMESVDGRTLEQAIPVNGLRVRDALRLAAQMADAFARAHGAGILHRDIKPSNVMVTEDGRVKILDFGLAKLTEKEPTPDDSTVANLTEEGAVVGTPDYMSPEQAVGEPLDARSDIFSFGVVLYQMVTGRKPFAADSRVRVFGKIVNEEPVRPSALAAIPVELEGLILRCLRKDPARRYQSMADLKASIEDIESQFASGTTETRVHTRRAILPIAVALIAVAGTTGFAVWYLTRAKPQPLREAVALTTFSGVESYPALSPDGNHLAFTWDGPGRNNLDVYVQLIGSGSPLRLTTNALSDLNPVWSPDGRWIAFLRGNPELIRNAPLELLLVPPLGGPERKITDVRVRTLDDYPQTFLAWCPDSRCVIVTDAASESGPEALFVISVETGEKRRLTHPQGIAMADTSPAISSDGRSLVFRRYLAWSAGELYRLPLADGVIATGEPERIADAEFNALYPAWMPDGETLIVTSRATLWKMPVDGKGEPARIAFIGEDGIMPAISRGQPNRLVYARSFFDSEIWRIDVGSPPSLAIASTRWEMHPRLSPDGRRVAFTSTRSGHWEIWTSDRDGSNAVQVTSMRARTTGGPTWSKDGRSIAYGSNLAGEFDIYVVPAGGGKPRRITDHPGFDQAAAFTADGRSMYFNSNRSGEFQIWKTDVNGGPAQQITTRGGWGPIIPRDGSALYYLRTADEQTSLWRSALDGSQETKLVDSVLWWSYWIVDRGVLFIDREGMDTRIRLLDFAAGTTTTVASNLGSTHCCLTATSDGRTILYTKLASPIDDLMMVENFQ